MTTILFQFDAYGQPMFFASEGRVYVLGKGGFRELPDVELSYLI